MINIFQLYDEDILKDDDYTLKLKQALNKIEETDKRILLLYAEYQSLRKVAKILNVSPSTVCNKVNEIRDKIKKILNDEGDNI